jgi:hypothetical protein
MGTLCCRVILKTQPARRLLPWVALVLLTAGCSPSSPSCTDQFGRGSSQPDRLVVTCLPTGSDLQCSSVATNTPGLYVYCPVSLQVTDVTTWVSSNPTVASFAQGGLPGYLKVLVGGQVQLTASYGFLSFATNAYAVAPGVAPERMVSFSVIVQDSVTSARVPGVQVDLSPDRGLPQTCQTGEFGSCLPSLWVLPGNVHIRLTKAGYQTGDTSVTLSSDSLSAAPILALARLSP